MSSVKVTSRSNGLFIKKESKTFDYDEELHVYPPDLLEYIELMIMYKCILADPPWNQGMTGKRTRKKGGPKKELPYKTMTLDEIKEMPVNAMADEACHLWLWTTNQYMRQGFDVMDAWGFKYLAPVHWIKPSGIGNWFVHRTQTLLFGYKDKCQFPLARYKPNIIEKGKDPVRHSEKPDASYRYIEAISPGPRIELFARRKINGWDGWGDEY